MALFDDLPDAPKGGLFDDIPVAKPANLASRSAWDFLKDSSLSAAKGLIGLTQVPVKIGKFAADNIAGGSSTLDQINNYLEKKSDYGQSLKSPKARAQSEAMQQMVTESAPIQTDGATYDQMTGMQTGYGPAEQRSLKFDPSKASFAGVLDMAIESAPQMVGQFALGKVLSQTAGLGRMGAEGRAMVGQAGSNTTIIASDTYDETYRAAKAKGMTDAQAVDAGNKAAMSMAPIAALTGGVLGKFTHVTPSSAPLSRAGKIAGYIKAGTAGAGEEGIEEGSQGMASASALGEDPLSAKNLNRAVMGALAGAPFAAGARFNEARSGNVAANALADALNGDPMNFGGNTPIINPETTYSAQPAAKPTSTQAPSMPKVALLALGFDPKVVNAMPDVMTAGYGSEAQAQPVDMRQMAEAQQQATERANLRLTPDIQAAIAKRTTPSLETDQVVSNNLEPELMQKLRAAGWTPPQQVFDQKTPLTAQEQEAMHQQNSADLEAAYQADIKDGIKRRLGIQPEAKTEKPTSYADSPFLREFAAQGGIAIDQRTDTAVDPKRLNSNGKTTPNPYNIGGKPLFRDGGLAPDKLVESLQGMGYLTQKQIADADAGGVGGSAELAYDMIRQELQNPGSVKAQNQLDDQANAMSQQRVSQDLYDQAQAIGLDTNGLTDQQTSNALARIERRRANNAQFDARREALAERQAMQDVRAMPDNHVDQYDSAWNNPSNTSTEDAMRSLGFTEQEIQNATNQPKATPENGASNGATWQTVADRTQGTNTADARSPRGREANSQQTASKEEILTSPTREYILALQDRITQLDSQAKADKAAQENKANADSQRSDFSLTGSDRAADANPNQNVMFSVADKTEYTPTNGTEPAPARQQLLVDKLAARINTGIASGRAPIVLHAVVAGKGSDSTMQRSYEATRAFSKQAFGHEVVFVDFEGSALFNGAMSDSIPNTVFININSKSPHMAVLGHELLHTLRATNPGIYRQLDARLTSLLSEDGARKFIDKLDTQYKKQSMTIPENWDEELYGDIVGDNFTDPEFLQLMAKDQPSAFRKVLDSIAQFLDSILAKFNGSSKPFGTDAYLTDVKSAREAVATAMREYSGTQVGAMTDAKQDTTTDVSLSIANPSWDVPDPTSLDEKIRALQDNKIDIKHTVNTIKETGAKIGDNANVYMRDELYIGRVRDKLDKLADDSVKPLLTAIANSGIGTDTVNKYLAARHAPERNAQMAKVNNVPLTQDLNLAGMSTKDAQAAMATFNASPDAAKLKRIATMVDEITRNARNTVVNEGLEDAGVIKAWESAYKFYVPLQRDVEQSGAKGAGYTVKGSESRRAIGSQKEAVNVLANVIAQAESTIIRSEKAIVGRSVLKLAEQNPNPDFWQVDTPPTEKSIDPRTGIVRTQVVPGYMQRDNVYVVKENGKERYIVFNEKNERAVQFARNLKNMDVANINKAVEVIGKGTRYLSQWVTSRNPLFWITNFARDVQGVAFNLQSTALAGQATEVMARIPKALAGLTQDALGKQGGEYAKYTREFAASGGRIGYMQNYADSLERMNDITKEVDKLKQSTLDPRKLGRRLLDIIDSANDVIENSVRLAVFVQARKEGISADQSASIAKNISVNFNRKGNHTATMNALFMFANANIQGNMRMLETISSSRRAQGYAAVLIAAGAALATLNYYAAGDDEESRRKRYSLVPEFERERNWILFYPNSDKYLKIPLPIGPHILFNAGRVVAEHGLEKDSSALEKAASFVGSFFAAFNPIGGGLPSKDIDGATQLLTPTIIRPIVDLAVNQNFAGNKISKEPIKTGYQKPKYQLNKDNTPQYWTDAAKALNDWTGGDTVKSGDLNITPEQLAYLLKSYIIPGVAQTADKIAGQAVSRKETKLSQIVGVSKFFGEIDEANRASAAYKTAEKDKQRLGEYKAYIAEGDADKAKQVLKDWGGGDEVKGRKLLSQVTAYDKIMAGIRKQQNAIESIDDEAVRNERLARLDKQRERTQSVYLANTNELRD